MRDKEKMLFILAVVFKPYIAIDIMLGLGYNKKQLFYYFDKWVDKGFLDFGTSMYTGWLVYSKFTGEYKRIFDNIIYYTYTLPKRALQHQEAKKQILVDLDEAEFYNKNVDAFKHFLINNFLGDIFK